MEGTEIGEGGNHEIRPDHREMFTDRGMARDFTERACHLCSKNSDDYTEYPMLEEQDRVTGYQNCSVASEGPQVNLTPCEDPNVDKLPEAVSEDDDWGFDSTIGRASTHLSV